MSEETEAPENKQENTENNVEKPVETVEEAPVIHERKSKPAGGGKLKQKWSQFATWYKTHKKISIPLTILVVVALILLIPFTRYKVLGLFMEQTVTISVKDSQTNRPVTEAQVSLAGKTANTDNEGQVEMTVKVGPSTAEVTKANYNDASVKLTVPVKKPSTPTEVSLQATGRVVPVKVTNKISGKPAEDVLVKSGEAEARTDNEGKATLVVPVDQTTVTVELSGDGYATTQSEVDVEKASQSEAELQVVPAGKVYFLSKQSGKIDVVKTNLDGSDRQVVLAGTGQEDAGDTILLASRDWKYLALKSKRDGGEYAKLFLIDTNGDKLTTMDEGTANFSLTGWDDHYFIYTVNRQNIQSWEQKKHALKSYNATNKQITTLDETQGIGGQDIYAYQYIDNVYAFGGKVIYTKLWYQRYSSDPANRKTQILSVNTNGQNMTSLKDFSTAPGEEVSFIQAKIYEPEEIYYWVNVQNSSTPQFYEYENGKVGNANSDANTFNKFYPTYLLSPSGNSNFWYEPRDGKNVMFVGDKDAKNEKQVTALSEYVAFGWYSEDYLLVSKDGSELYIMPNAENVSETQLVKVSDYHKPAYDFSGYGGGYGGF